MTEIDLATYQPSPSLRYSKDHLWVDLYTDGETAAIGITDYLAFRLGEIVLAYPPPARTKLTQFKEMMMIGATMVQDEPIGIVSPVSGVVIKRNRELLDRPQLAGEHPFGAGYLVMVSIENPEELKNLMDAPGYVAYLKEQTQHG